MGLWETILAAVVVAAMALLAGRAIWRAASGKDAGCGGCTGACPRGPGPDPDDPASPPRGGA